MICMGIKMEVYLDNSATTKVYDSVRDTMVKLLQQDFGNPSSMHTLGFTAETYIKRAKETISAILHAGPKEIIFTSGGTESNNMALIGAAQANRRAGNHLITTEIEHPSVASTMEYLEEQGFRVTYLKVNEKGVVSLQELEEAIQEDTILISVMYVNNEIGSIQPIEQIGRLIKTKNPKALFHVDAIQAFGKMEIIPKKFGIDLLSVSGHKIHGPKGVGFLYCRDKVKLKPLLHGGGQENGMRSGTENVPGIAALAQAAAESYDKLKEKTSYMITCKDWFIDHVEELEDVKVNSGKGEESAPHIVSVSFLGVRSEVLLHALEQQHIYVSAGSACSSNKPSVSATLKAIGLKKEEIESTLRFSFSDSTTIEELQYTIDTLKQLLPKLRLFRRR